MTVTLQGVLADRQYPGRVCLAAVTEDGVLVLAYAVTGRSPASRSRRLAELPSGDVEVHDTSGGPHDELRHYTALARRGPWLVIGNGDQVVPVADALAAGASELEVWQQHSYEPDPPIYTPRIWMTTRAGEQGVLVGWARRSAGGAPHRGLLAAERIAVGHGLLLSTYDGTRTDVRTSGLPSEILVGYPDAGALGEALFGSLDPDLRVAAFTVTPHEVCLLNSPHSS